MPIARAAAMPTRKPVNYSWGLTVTPTWLMDETARILHDAVEQRHQRLSLTAYRITIVSNTKELEALSS